MKLYELAAEYASLLEVAEDSDDDSVTLALEAIGGELEARCESIGRVLRTLEREAEMLRAEEQALAAKRKRIERNAERLEEHVRVQMVDRGIMGVKGSAFSWRLQENPPKVIVTNEAMVPDTYIRETVTRVVDKRAVLDAYKTTGECVPGTDVVRDLSLKLK